MCVPICCLQGKDLLILISYTKNFLKGKKNTPHMQTQEFIGSLISLSNLIHYF